MKIDSNNRKTANLPIIFACIWLFFSCIFIIKAFNEWKIYDVLSGNTPTKSTILQQKIVGIQNTLEASEAVKNQEYEKALQLISGNTSEDYYNRGTIQTLLAYKNGLQSTVSWLQTAQIFIAQAQQNFSLAKKLTDSRVMKNTITNNQLAVNSLSSVIDIKTCYGIGQSIISHISDITDTIKNIKKTLDEEDEHINRRANSLPATCYEKLHTIVDTSKEQVGLLQLQMDRNQTNYLSDFSDKIDNPMICIQTPYEDILPSMIEWKKWLEDYESQHFNTIEALKNNDSNSIKELCQQTKNDAQINQQIEDAVQELLQKLEDNTLANQEQKKYTKEVKYKDFFNEEEQAVLHEIQKANQWRIDTLLNIRWKWNYDPEQYINTMFNQFYGNSGDFIDLHK